MHSTPPAPARRIALALAALLFILLYGRYLIGFAPAGGDIINAYLPYQQLVRNALHEGCAPYWNSATFCGRPLMADIQVGVFYPPNWLNLLLPLPLSFALVLALHGLWMIAGCWKLGRAWELEPAAIALGTILFCANPFFTLKSTQGIVLFTYAGAWWPWVALGMIRLARQPGFGRLALLALALALSLLAGAPQITYYGWLAACALALVECGMRNAESNVRAKARTPNNPQSKFIIPLLWLAGAFALAFGLTAIQTLPTASFIGASFERGSAGGAGWDYIVDGSLTPRLFWLFVNPGFLGIGQSELANYFGARLDFAESCYYAPLWVAALLLPLGLVARRWKNAECGMRNAESNVQAEACTPNNLQLKLLLLGWVAMILGLALAPGEYSPVFKIFYRFFPGFNRFRVPSRLMLFFVCGESLVAALTLHALIRNCSRRTGARMLAIAGALAALALVWIPYHLRTEFWSEFGREIPGFFIQRGFVRNSAAFQQASEHAFNMGLIATAGLALAFAAVWLMTSGKEKSSFARAACWLLPILALAELFFLAWPFQKSVFFMQFQQTFYPQTELVKALQREHAAGGGRILWLDDVIGWLFDQNQTEIYPNRMVMHGLPDARGYDPVNARWIGQWMNLLAGGNPDENPHGFMFVPRIVRPAWLTLMGVEAVASYSDLSGVPGLKAVWQRDFLDENKQPCKLTVWRNERFAGMGFAAPAVGKNAGDEMQSLMLSAALAANIATSPTQAVVVSSELLRAEAFRSAPPADKIDGRFKVKPLPHDPNHFSFEVDYPAPALLCLAQSAYNGWSVAIDGVPGTIGTYSGTFLAAPIPAGPHTVVFDYLPERLALGRMISLIAVVVLLYGIVRTRWMK